MSPIRSIRQTFGLNQTEFGAIFGADQPTVSRLELEKQPPSFAAMTAIRDYAKRHRLLWDDAWFFDAPKRNGKASS